MPTPIEDLALLIDRLKGHPLINSKPGGADFISALNSLKALADKDLQQNWFLSLPRTKINWAPFLVKEVVDVLQEIKNPEDLDNKLRRLTNICDQYKQKKDITYPWAKILGILALSTIGLIIGAPIGAIIGAIAVAVTTPLWVSMNFGVSAGVMLLGAAIGALGGACGGAQLGFLLGTWAVNAEFVELINTIFYQEEQQALNQIADTLATCIEAIDLSATPGC